MFDLSPQLSFWAPSEKELRWQYEEIFEQGAYDDIRLPENAFVIDVGANIGLFSLLVKGRCPTAQIQAFEPMPVTRGALRRNIDRHGLDQIVIEECALGRTREEKVDFTYYPVLPGNSTRYPEQKELQKAVLARDEPIEDVEHQHDGYIVPVPVERLASFLQPGRVVDLLKIDTEGAELDVLLGVDPGQWRLIDAVVLEVQDLDGRLGHICSLLYDEGFRVAVRPSPMIPADIRTYLVHAVR
jgi:FkbM family methyltransferase